MIQKILLALVFLISMPVAAQYRMIVPQEPGGGTSVWASIIAKHLEKHLGEKIVLVHIPGARDIPGFNRFHNELRKDPKTIMVSHGGNAESFLGERVDYDYREYEPIGGMNLSIVTAHRSNFDPYANGSQIRFAGGSGNNPDMMAFTLLVCGELPTLDDYIKCFRQKAILVKGMRGGDRRLAYARGELNTTRETTAAFMRHVQPSIDKGDSKLWFSHGVLNLQTGLIDTDPNYPTAGSFEEVYRKRHGRAPAGPLYEAYVLVKQYRDVLQKAMWMDRGNPNAEQVRKALIAMLNDADAVKEIERDSGRYQWVVGQDLVRAINILSELTTESALQNFVRFQREAFEIESVYKPEIVRKK
jgi:hypothetical protein